MSNTQQCPNGPMGPHDFSDPTFKHDEPCRRCGRTLRQAERELREDRGGRIALPDSILADTGVPR